MAAARKGREGATRVGSGCCAALPRTAALTDAAQGLVRATEKHRQGHACFQWDRQICPRAGDHRCEGHTPEHAAALPGTFQCLHPLLASRLSAFTKPTRELELPRTQPFPAALDIASLHRKSLKSTQNRQLRFNIV